MVKYQKVPAEEMEERLAFFAEQETDCYEEKRVQDPLETYWLVKHRADDGSWNVARYTEESFRRYKLFIFPKLADSL